MTLPAVALLSLATLPTGAAPESPLPSLPADPPPEETTSASKSQPDTATESACAATAIAPPESATTPQLNSNQSFDDLQDHWARLYVDALARRGVLQGFPDGNFRPDRPLSRAEFAVLLHNVFGDTCDRAGVEFADVTADNWAREAIQHAHDKGFLKGFGDRQFYPERPISRVQVVVALMAGLPSDDRPASEVSAESIAFGDAAEIPPYARQSVADAISIGLVVPDAERPYLHPNREATRADVAALIYKALVRDGTIQPIEQTAVAAQAAIDHIGSSDRFLGDRPHQPPTVAPQTAAPANTGNWMAQLFADANSPGAIAIGLAEGTRTANGGYTRAYWGHRDPGNGKRNLGTFSYQHGAPTPQQADALQLRRLMPHIQAFQTRARSRGMQLSLLEIVAGADLATQAPKAARHYVRHLQTFRNRGLNPMEAILEATTHSFINPATGRLEAGGFGNSWARLKRDRARRLAAIHLALRSRRVPMTALVPSE